MAAKISLKLLIDEEKNRVAFAECRQDFVDVILSFLVLPIGTVVRLAGKESGLGCMDTLYESVENMDMENMQTQACKEMLLRPRNAWRADCNNLVIKINDMKYENYLCPAFNCSDSVYSRIHRLFSTVKNAKCLCGKMMDMTSTARFTDSGEGGKVGAFIKGSQHYYMITDDLHVTPISTSESLILLKQMGIADSSNLHEKNVQIGREEILQVLKHALLSETPLTDVFLAESDKVRTHDFEANREMIRKFVKVPGMTEKDMSMNIFLSKSSNKVLYAEASEDVVDFFFSFLTFPLGLIPKLCNGISSVGCLDHLYISAKDLTSKGEIRTEEHAGMLLRPKLAPHHSFPNQILKIKEAASDSISTSLGCTFHAKNPKCNEFVTKKGGGFVKGPATFMITDELDVKVASAISGLSVINNSNVLIDDIEDKIVIVGEEEALGLLKASLISTSSLSVVFGDKEG